MFFEKALKISNFYAVFVAKIKCLFTGNIEWNEPRDVVGAMVGEPLTIDCGAKGNPQPEIEMTNEEGEELAGNGL